MLDEGDVGRLEEADVQRGGLLVSCCWVVGVVVALEGVWLRFALVDGGGF